MKESIQIAYSVARQILQSEGNTFLEENRIHLHFPEGATPKDGPSAGVTLVTSILSLAKNYKVSNGIAMTGELSLKNRVLKIGGLKEKLIAAKRSGVKRVIVPRDNQDSLKEIPQELLSGVEISFADQYRDIYQICFQ